MEVPQVVVEVHVKELAACLSHGIAEANRGHADALVLADVATMTSWIRAWTSPSHSTFANPTRS